MLKEIMQIYINKANAYAQLLLMTAHLKKKGKWTLKPIESVQTFLNSIQKATL